jgi:hypothetical protein
MATEWHHAVFSTSTAQRSLLLQAIKNADTKNVYRVYECNWEKVTRFTGALLLKDSGPRYCTNHEAITHVMCGPEFSGQDMLPPLSPIMFPFWDSSKGLPQPVQDELRVASFRVSYENGGFTVTTAQGTKKRANKFEKGQAFGEFTVGELVYDFCLGNLNLLVVLYSSSYSSLDSECIHFIPIYMLLTNLCVQVWRTLKQGDWCADLCGGQGSVAYSSVWNWRNAVYVEEDYAQLVYFIRRCTQTFEKEAAAYEEPIWLPTFGLLRDADDAIKFLNNTITEVGCKYFPSDWLLAKHEPQVHFFPVGSGISTTEVSKMSSAMSKSFRAMEPLRVGYLFVMPLASVITVSAAVFFFFFLQIEVRDTVITMTRLLWIYFRSFVC